MASTESERALLARTVELATTSVAEDGGPFGALVVTAEGPTFEGTNRVTASNDPTAHAEVAAIRAACATLGTFELPGAVLYASCEPCPMCLATSLWARIDRVVFAADRHDASIAGFDDAAFYEYFENPEQRPLLPIDHVPTDGARAPFEIWRDNGARTEY